MTKASKALRKALARLWTKQCLTFLFFLALSTTFWLSQTLNEVYEEEFEVPVEIKSLPRGIVLTSDVSTSIRVTLKDRGVTLLNYKYGDKIRHIVVDSTFFSGNEGHVRLLVADMLRQIRPSLAQGTQVVSIKPDTLDFYYNRGLTKRVPVKMTGKLLAATGYTITGHRFSPDSVTVSAASGVLDTISAIYLRTDGLREQTTSSQIEFTLPHPRGVKVTPAKVKLMLGVDRLVEKRLTLPVYGEGFPANIQLRTFPAQVEVIFQVSMSLYRSITPDHFHLVVNYGDLPTDGSNHCRVTLKTSPAVASHIRLATEEVEYVLETQNH